MITAIILAAGESKRMGSPKMLLPWRQGTVLGQVISVFAKAGLEDILVITGSEHEQIEDVIAGMAGNYPVRSVYNEEYASGDMLSSIQTGLRDLAHKEVGAAMIGLGDQPQVEEGTVRAIRDSFERTHHRLIVPSHANRRGHPWLVGQEFWGEILGMRSPQTPRDFLSLHAAGIHYVESGSSSILADLDTPEDYGRAHPN
jgi:molybdenum cofactor cytidylyltransferase